MTADPFAIAEVSFVNSPATDMTMEGETLVDGKPVGVLKARTFAAAGTDGNPLYNAAASCPPTYTVVPVEVTKTRFTSTCTTPALLPPSGNSL